MEAKHRKVLTISLNLIVCAMLFAAFVAFFSAKWYINTYGQLGFDSVMFTLLADLDGVGFGLVWAYLLKAMLPAVCVTAVVCLIFFPIGKLKQLKLRLFDKKIFPLNRVTIFCISIPAALLLVYTAAKDVELIDYLKYQYDSTQIYEEKYVDPTMVKITFPEKKRNLVYIFLESMENTFFSQAQGGALKVSAAPELYQLAQDNTSFSHNEGFGGLRAGRGTTWTIAAMVAQSSGIPLKVPPGIGGNEYGKDGVFLPGVTTITDILHENGYYQTLMVGSDASFGGRKAFYQSHGVDKILDLYTAREEGLIPDDYFVWWGFEDRYLLEYAKEELTTLAAKEQPFALTLLTVDTHHVGGYVCPDCEDDSRAQYERVVSCSSKKVYEFVQWIQQQPFYENTTVVIVGDHPSMDISYISSVTTGRYDRRVYNCFINSAVKAVNTQNRKAFMVDMFPTTLAAMGIHIEGERLGMGTNLFSDTLTLAEELGNVYFEDEMFTHSDYYYSHFFQSESE